MDEFDVFNQPSQGTQSPALQNTNPVEDDLFGSETTPASTNQVTVDLQEDQSWVIENNVTGTASTPTLQKDLVPEPSTTLLNDDLFSDQSNTNEFDTPTSINLPPTAEQILYNDPTKQQSEETSSYEMFSNPTSSSSTVSNPISFSTLPESPLQAFNTRRQQEIAAKDAEEKRKIEELRRQAKEDIERWYKDRNTRMEQKRETMKQNEATQRTEALEKSDKNTCDWAKVVRFLEFAQGTQLSKGKRDLNRMKSSMIHAKRDKDRRASENGLEQHQ